MNLILIAPPAAGKGTFASRLKNELNLVTISAGELLRGVSQDTELGKQIRILQSERKLISDEITNKLIEDRLKMDDIKNGFVLDGYPRHMGQVEALDEMMKRLNLHIDYVVLLNVTYEEALKRTLGRQICPKCKRTYNKLTGVNAPLKENICDDCNVMLTVRNDDNEETFKKGFDTYNQITLPVVEYYRSKGNLIELESNTQVFDEFMKRVKND